MKNSLFMRITTVIIALITTAYVQAADRTYVTKVTITRITNNTKFDLPQINLLAHSNTSLPWEYSFPSDRPKASAFTSQVYLNGVHQNCLFGGGANNFGKPYVGAYFSGKECNVKVIVNQENDTTFNIILEQNKRNVVSF